MLRNPKPHTEFRRFKERLALFRVEQDQDDYWAEYWDSRDWVRVRGSDGCAELGEVGRLCRQYISPDDYVLEAGCGMGLFVSALHNDGNRVVGVERSVRVVDRVHREAPHLDVQSGDVEALDFPDETFQSYVSIGVVEHNEDGPCAALSEARRVLVTGGWALISVPFLNPLRKEHLKRLSGGDVPNPGFTFHQYYFDSNEFVSFLSAAGIRVVAFYPYAVEAFLTREHLRFSAFWASRWRRERVKKFFRGLFVRLPSPLRWRYAHMLMFVCQAV